MPSFQKLKKIMKGSLWLRNCLSYCFGPNLSASPGSVLHWSITFTFTKILGFKFKLAGFVKEQDFKPKGTKQMSDYWWDHSDQLAVALLKDYWYEILVWQTLLHLEISDFHFYSINVRQINLLYSRSSGPLRNYRNPSRLPVKPGSIFNNLVIIYDMWGSWVISSSAQVALATGWEWFLSATAVDFEKLYKSKRIAYK